MNYQTLRIAAFALLGVSILLGRFAPEEWTWAAPVAGVCAVVALLTMIVSFVKGRQAPPRHHQLTALHGPSPWPGVLRTPGRGAEGARAGPGPAALTQALLAGAEPGGTGGATGTCRLLVEARPEGRALDAATMVALDAFSKSVAGSRA